MRASQTALLGAIVSMAAATLVLIQFSDRQGGVPKEQPRSHYAPNGDGTVTNTWSQRVWLQHATCFGETTWAEALEISTALAAGRCGLQDGSLPGDWRLPTRKELQSLLDPRDFSPAMPSHHPFAGVQDGCYWLASVGADRSLRPDHIYIGAGGAGLGGMNSCLLREKRRETTRFYFWPVRND